MSELEFLELINFIELRGVGCCGALWFRSGGVKMKVLPGLGCRVVLGERVACFSCALPSPDNAVHWWTITRDFEKNFILFSDGEDGTRRKRRPGRQDVEMSLTPRYIDNPHINCQLSPRAQERRRRALFAASSPMSANRRFLCS